MTEEEGDKKEGWGDRKDLVYVTLTFTRSVEEQTEATLQVPKSIAKALEARDGDYFDSVGYYTKEDIDHGLKTIVEDEYYTSGWESTGDYNSDIGVGVYTHKGSTEHQTDLTVEDSYNLFRETFQTFWILTAKTLYKLEATSRKNAERQVKTWQLENEKTEDILASAKEDAFHVNKRIEKITL
jgi:hypothetical protein